MVPPIEWADKVSVPPKPEYGITNRDLWMNNKVLRKRLEQANEQLGKFRDYIRYYQEKNDNYQVYEDYNKEKE